MKDTPENCFKTIDFNSIVRGEYMKTGEFVNNNLFKDIIKFLTNRLFILAVLSCAAFYLLFVRLFDLQIVRGEEYKSVTDVTTVQPLTISAPRGNIYDRYGRPLAVNKSAFTVIIDPSAQVQDINSVLYNLMKLFERNNEDYVYDLPISMEKPYEFLFTGTNSDRRELKWKKDMNVSDDKTAEETVEYLISFFDIDKFQEENGIKLNDSELMRLLNLRSMVYLYRYQRYKPMTVAYDVSRETVVSLEEENEIYAGVFIETDALRHYPAGKYFTHILGYTGKISDTEITSYKNQGYEYGSLDIVGKTGLELSLERDLRGTDGSMQVDVNVVGRRIRVLEQIDPVQGNKVFLTLDMELQKKVYEILEDTLTNVIKAKLQGLSNKESPITLKQLFMSMVKANSIPLKKIMDSEEGSFTYNIKSYVLDKYPEANVAVKESREDIKTIINEGIDKGHLSFVQMLLTLNELEIISGDEAYIAKIRSGALKPLAVVLEKLDKGELTPQLLNLDPSTASAAVVDVHNGDVLAAIGYPSYDNNELVNNFNNDYWYALLDDPTYPLIHRPFYEQRAPGSTFKMISAIAGLESGVISPTTTIYDEVSFTKAGPPPAKCWSTVTHGRINVSTALEVSCNYFFCELAYRLGNSKSGNKLDSIDTLNRYMRFFGLNDRTGVEIGERHDEMRDDIPRISSPELKEANYKRNYADPSVSQYSWNDGDSVRTAFGQSENSYTVASMVKYIATLANKGVRYQLHLVDKVETNKGELVRQIMPVVETKDHIDISEETWDAVYKGMLLVTQGLNGTGRAVYSDFPITIASKTGTAQENTNRNDHSSFGGFAPYNDPEIAVYVCIPFGNSYAYPAASSQAAKRIIGEYMGLYSESQPSGMNNGLVP